MPKKRKKQKGLQKKPLYLLLRYLILFGLMFTLPLIYKIFTPLTVYFSGGLLKLFYQVSINGDIIKIFPKTTIQIIPACVAGSAYLLSLILNLSVSMKIKKRICSILFAFALLFALNVLRIFILSIFLVKNFQFFNFTHKLFWYILSTLFVVGIWFLTIKIFRIKEIPVYSDIEYLIENIKKR